MSASAEILTPPTKLDQLSGNLGTDVAIPNAQVTGLGDAALLDTDVANGVPTLDDDGNVVTNGVIPFNGTTAEVGARVYVKGEIVVDNDTRLISFGDAAATTGGVAAAYLPLTGGEITGTVSFSDGTHTSRVSIQTTEFGIKFVGFSGDVLEIKYDGEMKIGWFAATPVAQQPDTTDIKVLLQNLGLMGTGTNATPMDLNGGELTAGKGTFSKATTSGVVTLTDAATVATDASLGNKFRVTLGGNRTLGNVTGASDAQDLMWLFKQDGTGSRTITLDTGYVLNTDVPSVVLSTTIGVTDALFGTYDSAASKVRIWAFSRGSA